MFSINITAFIKTIYSDAFRLASHPRQSISFLYNISLYRNASYLMANTGITAILGIAFWVLAARLYSEEDVGLGSALISAGMLLSFIGSLGLGFGIIRFLPHYSDKGWLLNYSFVLTVFAAVAAAFIYLAGLSLWTPKLLFVRDNLFYISAFIIFITAGALANILNQTFIGFRRSGFTLTRGIIFSVGKLILVAALVALSKTFGIFASWGIAMVISALVGFFFFLPWILPGYRPLLSKFRKPNELDKEMLRFSLANYGGQAFQNAPIWILPLLVLNLEGSEANAHFYIAWTMASVILNIAIMTSMSLFAESSNVEERMGADLRKSLKLMMSLIIPAVIIILLLGGKLLLLFGSDYSDTGTHLLWLLTLSALPASINYLYLGIARVERKIKAIIYITGILAFGSLISSYWLLSWLGIVGVGVAWLAMHCLVALICTPRIVKKLIILPSVTTKPVKQEDIV